MNIPERCVNCPNVLTLQKEAKELNETDSELKELAWSEQIEANAQREYLLAQTQATQYKDMTVDQIAQELRKDLAVEMDDNDSDITALEEDVENFVKDCEGPVRLIGAMQRGRIYEAVVCASPMAEIQVANDIEPAIVYRYVSETASQENLD